jgi:hypothetical protein
LGRALGVSLREFRVRVTNLSKVRGTRLYVKLGEESVVTWVILELGHFTVLIIEIPKGASLSRTALFASDRDAFDNLLAYLRIERSVSLTLVNALNTISTFLHDTTESHRHVRITPHVEQFILVLSIVIEVETTHFERTVVRTITCTNTAVINHIVQPLWAVYGSRYGTNILTWRGLTLLT